MNMQHWSRIMASAVMSLCLYSTAGATITVTTTTDVDSGVDGVCSLREAIIAVNSVAPYNECAFTVAPETIIFAVPAPSTITLLSALPALLNTVTITGPGAASLAISGGNLFRVFDITAGTVTISGLTIRNGNNAAGAGLRLAPGSTGNISTSMISNNTGDGILNNGTLLLSRSTVNDNAAGGSGIHALLGISTTIVNSTISSNLGNGILVAATSVLFTMSSSTVTGNAGAGLSNEGTATVNSTIFSGHTAGGNCAGTQPVTSSGYNLEDTNICVFTNTGDLVDTNPLLGPLQSNGGPTFTHALTGGIGASPAIDKGDPAPCGTTLVVDQRGAARPSGSACDIGAYERQPGANGGGGGGGGSGCSLAGEGAVFDPILWLLVLVSCSYLGYRRFYIPGRSSPGMQPR